MIKTSEIISDTNPILRENSKDVSLPLSKEDEKLLDDMMEYIKLSQDKDKAIELNLNPGVGLAAPQLGILKKMFVVYTTDEKENVHEYALVNPQIVSTSVANSYLAGGEGCLSVPTMHEGYVKRHYKIKIKAYDHVSKQNVVLSLKGYVAIVVQHEYDHLFGTLYYDRINKKDPFAPIDGYVVE